MPSASAAAANGSTSSSSTAPGPPGAAVATSVASSSGSSGGAHRLLQPALGAEVAAKKAPFMAFKPRAPTAAVARKISTLPKSTTNAARPFANSAGAGDCSSGVPPMATITSANNNNNNNNNNPQQTSVNANLHMLFEETVSPLEVSSTFDEPDPYDPWKPNDYSKICQEREDLRRQAAMIEENTVRPAINNTLRSVYY